MKNEDIVKYADKLKSFSLDRDVNIMEVCGTHTMQFFHTGVKDIFPKRLNLIDGPGCPVCVTANDYLDRAIEIMKQKNVIIATFGDMLKVPSSYSSLQKEKAAGRDVEIVYSPLDALKLAEENPSREVVFLSVGFETTIPTEGIAVKNAISRNIKNFSILTGNKLTPPAVKALLGMGEVKIDGFILPGHASIITGVNAWNFIRDKYSIPSVVTGFETKDLIFGTLILLELIKDNKSDILNSYKEVVSDEGNVKAQKIIYELFDIIDENWRGIGVIPESGLVLKDKFSDYDAAKKFPVQTPPVVEPEGCRCGEILRGLITPLNCPLFGNKCTPRNPVGACMVSSEGACAAFFKYKRN